MPTQRKTNIQWKIKSPSLDLKDAFEFGEILNSTSTRLCASSHVMSLPLAYKPSRRLRIVKNTLNPPFRLICKIYGANIGGDREEGTGILISHNHVLTTAHVLLNSSKKIVKPNQVEILPGVNDGFIPFESSTAKKITIFPGYIHGTEVCVDDIAIIETEDFVVLNSPDSSPGFWGVAPNNIDSRGTTIGAMFGWRPGYYKVNMSGYPSGSEIQHRSFDNTINISKSKLLTLPTDKREKFLFIKNDARPGMSGSPVWVKRHNSSGGRVAVAIFLGMDEIAGKRYAVARLITDDVIDFILKITGITVREAELTLFNGVLSHNKASCNPDIKFCEEEIIDLKEKEEENEINFGQDLAFKGIGDDMELDLNENTLLEKANIFRETEANYGSSATQQKVCWYQAILKIVVADPTVFLTGNHNTPETRKALYKLQEFYGLKPTSYLTVESNAALNQLALEWIYRFRIPNKIGKWSQTLTNQVKQFQFDYNLKPDGKVGTLTRAKMMDILLAKLPTPIKSFHSQLGSSDTTKNQTEVFGLDSWKNIGHFDTNDKMFDEFNYETDPSGIHGRDNRYPVTLPANIPWRWICRIKIDGLWAGTGVLISPRHVLTAGHIVYGDKNDVKDSGIMDWLEICLSVPHSMVIS